MTVYAESRHLGLKLILRYGSKTLPTAYSTENALLHTKVLHDICGTRLCSLESQNMHAEAPRALHTWSCGASPLCARCDYTVKYLRPCADFKPAIWRQTFSCTYRRERTALAFTHLFYLLRWGHYNNGGHHATAEPH